MKIGERARLMIKSELTRGGVGCQPHVPRNMHLTIDVNLICSLSPETTISFDKESRNSQGFKENLIQVDKLLSEGNEQLEHKNIKEAIYKYYKAIGILKIFGSYCDEDEVIMMKYMNNLYTILSKCFLKIFDFYKVCRMCEEAIKLSRELIRICNAEISVEIYLNWGKALRFIKLFSEAKLKLREALKLEPDNVAVQTELQNLEKDENLQNDFERILDEPTIGFYGCSPPTFWNKFNQQLMEFMNNDDNLITIKLNEIPNDIEIARPIVESFNLNCYMIKLSGVAIDRMAIYKYNPNRPNMMSYHN